MKNNIDWLDIADTLKSRLLEFDNGSINQAQLDAILSEIRAYCCYYYDTCYSDIQAAGITELIEEMIWKVNE